MKLFVNQHYIKKIFANPILVSKNFFFKKSCELFLNVIYSYWENEGESSFGKSYVWSEILIIWIIDIY